MEDKVLFGECISGALYWKDFIALAKKVGFDDPRLVEVQAYDKRFINWKEDCFVLNISLLPFRFFAQDSVVTVENPELESRVKGIKFASVTYRLFKLPEDTLEEDQEDYGQTATYKGVYI